VPSDGWLCCCFRCAAWRWIPTQWLVMVMRHTDARRWRWPSAGWSSGSFWARGFVPGPRDRAVWINLPFCIPGFISCELVHNGGARWAVRLSATMAWSRSEPKSARRADRLVSRADNRGHDVVDGNARKPDLYWIGCRDGRGVADAAGLIVGDQPRWRENAR